MEVDLDKIREVVQSLDTEDYIRFMKGVHFDYPLKTKELTEEIMNSWKKDHSMKVEKFNAIIEERKAEHIQEAREKRQGGLIRIQNLKSTTGKDTLEIFPKEIWAMILDDLSPEGKRNAREVHDLFCDLTEKTLVGDVLLPLILKFFVNRSVETHRSKGRYELNRPLLNFLRRMRLVSKSLRNAIDQWFEDDLISLLRNNGKNAHPAGIVSIYLFSEHNCQQLEKIAAELSDSSSPSTPQRFFTRSLSFVLDDEDDLFSMFDFSWENKQEQLEAFPGNMNKFLDHVGHQIWYFSFQFRSPQYSENAPAFGDRYNLFLGWLSKMPNLKWMKIIINLPDRDGDYSFKIPEWLKSKLPELKNLERLDLELGKTKSDKCVSHIWKEFLSAYPHVKILNLLGLKPMTTEDSECLKMSFKLEMLESFGADGPYNGPNLAGAIANTGWPLKSIDLDFNIENMSVYFVFRCLEKVPTLEKVILALDSATVRDEVSYLKLPELKHFELTVQMDDHPFHWHNGNENLSFFFSIQFLIFAKKLSTMYWKCEMEEYGWEKVKADVLDSEEESIGVMIDFGGGGAWDIGEDSNLWRVFPWLNTVKTERIVRDSFEKKSIVKWYRMSELDLS